MLKNGGPDFYQEQIEGNTTKLNDEFTFLAAGGAHFSKQKLVEIIPNERLVWLVTDSKLTFLEHNQEWIGTKFGFEISRQGTRTKLCFTHVGLIPEVECYEDCTMGCRGKNTQNLATRVHRLSVPSLA